MQIINKIKELSSQCMTWRNKGESICLVPTMGYYHAGHENLMACGRKAADHLIVSSFVNPAQFGPTEDLAAYPRDLDRDSAIAERYGTEILFAPDPEEMYAEDFATWVEVPELAKGLCGQSRPVHFKGVCTIVLKLLMITSATVAIFGEKDWQQQAIIRRMVRDLNIPVQIVTRPTVREADGLALSSRNVYLTCEERRQAPHIHKGLELARQNYHSGITNPTILRQKLLAYWAEYLPLGRLDYLSVVDPMSLTPLTEITGPALMACAVKMGKARLIDNILLQT